MTTETSTSWESKPPTDDGPPDIGPPDIGLGDCVAVALEAVGVTPDRVEAWLGLPCRCAERKAAMNRWRIKRNRLKVWAARFRRGLATVDHLAAMLDE